MRQYGEREKEKKGRGGEGEKKGEGGSSVLSTSREPSREERLEGVRVLIVLVSKMVRSKRERKKGREREREKEREGAVF